MFTTIIGLKLMITIKKLLLVGGLAIATYYSGAKAVLFINLVGQPLALVCDNQEIDCITECSEIDIKGWLAGKTFTFKIDRRPLSFETLCTAPLNDISNEAIYIIDNAGTYFFKSQDLGIAAKRSNKEAILAKAIKLIKSPANTIK
jgi:hypothetical protein